MALTPSQQMLRWSLALFVFIAILWVLGDVMTPYLAGMALAYFLDPVADRLEARGLSRLMSVVIIMLVGMCVMLLVIVPTFPLIFEQLSKLIQNLPALGSSLQGFLAERFPSLNVNASSIFERLQEAFQGVSAAVFDAIITSTKTIFGFIALIVIVPVVTFYMLLSWDKMVAIVDSWLPRDHKDEVRLIMRNIDKTLAGFIRGQGTVCLIMAAYYATVLSLVGLQYGLIIGLIAGLLCFIPYIGAFIGAALAVGFGLYQFWGDWFQLGLMIALYFGGQSLEGNVITPRLVGNSVGLHPVWLMFSLSVFGSFMGLTGMLIAVPVAASIGVVGRYFLGQYKRGRLYLGKSFYSQGDDGDA